MKISASFGVALAPRAETPQHRRRGALLSRGVPSESSQEAAVLLKILKAIEKLCKNNALQVGDLRHTLEDSHGELLRQLLMGTGDTERCEALTTRVASAAAASTAATTSEAVTTAVREASFKAQEQLQAALFQHMESLLAKKISQIAEETVAASMTKATQKLQETMEKLLTNAKHTRYGETEEQSDSVFQQVPSQPSPASFGMSEAVLMSKDIGPDLSWIQSMLHDIKRENAGNRQLLGWICHNLDAALCSRKYQEQLQLHLHQRRGQREEERGEGGDTARTFHIFTPVDLSRQSSTASLYHEEETERVITATMEDNGREDKSRPHAHVAPPCIASPSSPVEPCAQIYRKVSSVETEQKETEDEEEDEASCVASPRAVVEKASINMTESFEKFNCKNHHFPNVYTSTGNLEWEHYVSTSKGLHKGTG
ncbi:uncharacterized protein LOC34617385 [Cyclospora cayetanensis]|uniref:Uncharacterized protein LOC34617385 n=1 Tax=Cyclospora cayetanensis TaxID=88456 RepID=A0A6P6RYX8_9EIME|nr:uncharacterized protein LOC34617385 [Cyclospora cayetanensis]